MWRRTIRWAVVFTWTAAGLGLALPAVAVEKEGLSKAQRLELLRPLYEQVRRDAGLKAIEPGRLKRMNDPAAVEAYLKALPLSPRDYLEIDMQMRRYEVMVPRFIESFCATSHVSSIGIGARLFLLPPGPSTPRSRLHGRAGRGHRCSWRQAGEEVDMAAPAALRLHAICGASHRSLLVSFTLAGL